jgi:hypothetical protein
VPGVSSRFLLQMSPAGGAGLQQEVLLCGRNSWVRPMQPHTMRQEKVPKKIKINHQPSVQALCLSYL